MAQRGDLAQAEATLMGQASSLQELFTRRTERAMSQTHTPNLEGFMRLALRAQSQCRAILETLGTIQNPPLVYARQANVTTGPQQINNTVTPPAREMETPQTQLLRTEHGKRLNLERRAKQAAAIRRWQLWTHSTGPKSAEGKARSAKRGDKGGARALIREVARLVREQSDARNALEHIE